MSEKKATRTVITGRIRLEDAVGPGNNAPRGDDPYFPEYQKDKCHVGGYARSDDLPQRIPAGVLIRTDDPRQIQKPDRTDATRLKRVRYL